MSYPITVGVTFDFSSGATFGYPFILDDPANGLLGGSNTLGTTIPKIVDISSQVINISINGGYNLLRDQFEASQATFTIYDDTGIWNPTNPASPYYPNLTPLKKIRVSGTYNGVGYFIFSGYTTSYNYQYPKDQQTGYVVIQAVDAFRLFQMNNVSAISGATAGQDTGTRINKILDAISWPASLRKIDTGGTETLVQADPATLRTALDAIKMVEFTEQGAFYINGEGQAEFHSRQYVMQTSNKAPVIYFSNAGDGIPYFNIVPAYDDKLIINQAGVQNIGGTLQQASNSTSITKYFPHTYTQQNALGQTNADALNIAQIYVATRQETTIRIDAMTIDMSSATSAGIQAALAGDYFQTFRIKNVAQDGTVLDKTLQVVGIAHSITPTIWRTTFTTSEPITQGFILDNSIYGKIDDYNSTLGY